MRLVVEAQLDPDMSSRERMRQLRKVAEIIEYLQDRRERAARSHRKTRLRRLRSRGIYVSKLPKCFGLL